MNQVPQIKKNFWNLALSERPVMLDVANRALELQYATEANAEQEQPLITAEEARKLGVGKAEFQAGDGEWIVCKPIGGCVFPFEKRFLDNNEVIKYRAIKQPEPVEPTCQVRNLDTGETETMTREAAKLLQDETKDACDWFVPNSKGSIQSMFEFTDDGIYTYKPKANLVKLDGELMTREAAIVKWESRKDTCDCYVSTESRPMWEATKQPSFSRHDDFGFCEYQIRAKPLKQVSWNDVPVGVAVRDMVNNVTWLYQGFDHASDVLLTNQKNMPFGMRWDASQNLELAAASEQPWIAVQDGETCHGIALDLATKGLVVQKHERDEKYRITGLAEGHELK